MDNESILICVKRYLDISEDDGSFDNQIIDLINTNMLYLYQLGVGDGLFSVTGENEVWEDLVPDDPDHERDSKLTRNCIKSIVGWRVRLSFDPPQNSALQQAIKDGVAENEERLIMLIDKQHYDEGII